MGNSDVTITWT